jgi:hypothetical protein
VQCRFTAECRSSLRGLIRCRFLVTATKVLLNLLLCPSVPLCPLQPSVCRLRCVGCARNSFATCVWQGAVYCPTSNQKPVPIPHTSPDCTTPPLHPTHNTQTDTTRTEHTPHTPLHPPLTTATRYRFHPQLLLCVCVAPLNFVATASSPPPRLHLAAAAACVLEQASWHDASSAAAAHDAGRWPLHCSG